MHLIGDELRELPIPPAVSSAYRDPSGTVWMGTAGKLWRLRNGAAELASAIPGGDSAFIRAMTTGRAGVLWISLNAAGLFRFVDGDWTPTPALSAESSQIMPVSATSDAAGRAWFGYRDNLVSMRDGETIRTWDADDGVDIGNVTAVYAGEQRTWIAGQLGVALLDGERFRRVQLGDDELFSRVYAVFESENRNGRWNDLWIHSVAGIFQVPGAELEKAISDAGYRALYRSFDRSGGLPDDPIQIIPLPTAVKATDGRLWFATSNGAVFIDPRDIESDTQAPVVFIEALRADDSYFVASGDNRLPALTRRIVIEYTAPSLSAPEAVQFRYRLDGYDEHWIDAGSRREVTYTGLRPGNYRFEVIAFSSDGVLSEAGATTSFFIAPAFYQRKLFYAASVALILGGLWLAYRMQLRITAERLRLRLTERHEERERIARELHDTLLQGVHGLLLRFQSIADRMSPDDPSRPLLESALDRADQALVEGRDRVRGLRTAANADLAQSLQSTGEELARGHPSAFECSVSGAPKPIQADTRDELFCIGQEALLNAFHHAEARKVCAAIHFDAKELRLSVRDDGRGAPSKELSGELPGHWGFAGMRERAARIGANFEVHTAPDKGLEIIVTVPAAKAWDKSPTMRRKALANRDPQQTMRT
jgi:signal transduction histidine kinase